MALNRVIKAEHQWCFCCTPVYFQLTSSRWRCGSLGMCFFIQDQQWTCWSVGEMIKKLKRKKKQHLTGFPSLVVWRHDKLHSCSVIVQMFPTCFCWGGPRCSRSRSPLFHSACRYGRCAQQEHPGRWHTGTAAAPKPGPPLTETSRQSKVENIQFNAVHALLSVLKNF